jgi:uncharacterized iron-regulated membrane protein
MIPFDRILMAQVVAVAAAMVTAVAGGLLARSWLWAVACAVLVYAAFSVGVMIWLARRLRSDRDWLDLDDDWAGEPSEVSAG